MARLPFALVCVSLIAATGHTPSFAEDGPKWRHATSLIGKPSHPPGFKHFNYVNPNAPKGGVARLTGTDTFNTFNPVLLSGNAANGLGTTRSSGLVHERLMVSSFDQSSTEYGLLAEALRYPDDYSWVAYRLRPNARWHDGKPVTAEDVLWSYKKAVELNVNQKKYYEHVTKAEITGEREVTFTFDQKGNRELPHIVGQLLVLPKHWWEGTDANGKKRDISKSTLEPPLGSGPYRLKSFSPGKSIVYERVKDYWAKDTNVRIGYYNFDEIRYEFFRDDTVEFEAFKADKYDWRDETTARRWAINYDFPAVKEGRVIRQLIENDHRSAGLMVGLIPNIRRDLFKDPRVRLALTYVFDFESLNKDLFYNQYRRPVSFFDGTELASSGLPEGQELAILEKVRNQVPEDVFTKEFSVPNFAQATDTRKNLGQAFRLLKEAGWVRKGNALVNAKTGKPFEFELLQNGSSLTKVTLRYKASLARIGIKMNIREVDPPQYVNRVRKRDFDMIWLGWAQSLSPGNEQRFFFHSSSADQNTSRNWGGIKNPAVDALIERVIFAKDRAELVAATKALDRVLLWNHYIIPGWVLRKDRIARWDRFSHPNPLPYYNTGFPEIWWYDKEKAAKTGEAK